MLRASAIVFTAFLLTMTCLVGQSLPPKPLSEIKTTVAEELAVLTQTIPSYEVSKMPATKALEHLWAKTLGRKPESISFRWVSQTKSECSIDLHLRQVPVLQVVAYIADLSAARWRIRGIDGVSQVFELEAIEVADDTENWVAATLVELNAQGMENLGMKAGMNSEAILDRLEAYGVRVDRERNSAAVFNPATAQLAAIVSVRDVEFVKNLGRLANAGLLVKKP